MNTRQVAKCLAVLVLGSGLAVPAERAAAERSGAVADCVFQKNPARFRDALRLHMEELSARTERVALALPSAAPIETTAAASTDDVASRNYIDDYIFGKMRDDGVPHAPQASDAEFLRRVSLDLAGRIPSSADVRSFLADNDPGKRSNRIRSLIGSPEFVDKWTMYYGDLLRNTAAETNVIRYAEGRNAFYNTIKSFVSGNTPYDVFVGKLITGSGNSYTVGEVNFPVGGVTPMGPVQDTYDTLWVRTATEFLGLSNFDCLLCHNGAGHLDTLNLWGSRTLRSEAWGMSAFFARTRITRRNIGNGTSQYSWDVSDTQAGDYQLNTNSGNRTARTALPDGSTVAKPKYMFAPTQASGSTYREMLANNLIKDRQFTRAAVNYLWRELMGQGIVEPADQFDPARLDPANPPPDGWTIQPSHPELLEALTDDFIKHGFDVRYILNLIADSSAYQLSSRFDGEWKIEYEPYFARKFVRRLWSEELHDAITKAAGIPGSYTPQAYTSPVQWAMQLPDTVEPRRNNAAVTAFLDYFLRGNRDQNQRSGDASILQALNIMNNTFVTSRIKSSDSRTTVAKLLADKTLSDSALIEELFLSTLGRYPTAEEKSLSLDTLKSSRSAGAENVQWVLLNKIDFLYNY
jgi:hypothetical protein